MFQVDNRFLEDEVREGFFIPSMVKRGWAVELSVLYEIDRICQKHHIAYFADWGTLIGAVRHGGFIPWDDDLDIVMHRNEYEKFLKYAKEELPKDFYIVDFESNDYFWQFNVTITSYNRMCFEPEYLKTHYNFPYMAGIDIFILDHVAPDEALEEKRIELVKYLFSIAEALENDKLTKAEINNYIALVQEKCGITLNNDLDQIEIRRSLYRIIKGIFLQYNQLEASHYTQLMPWGLFYKRYDEKRLYNNSIRVPFENIEINLPLHYDFLLREKYGDYFRIFMNGSAHGYPFYAKQRDKLQSSESLIPKYVYSADELNQKRTKPEGTLKDSVSEAIDTLTIFTTTLSEQFSLGKKEVCLSLLADLQQYLISIGTVIEDTKGGNHPSIGAIEHLCESIFHCFEGLSEQEKNVSPVSIEALSQELTTFLETLKQTILNRKTVVFLPFRNEHFNTFETLFFQKSAESDTDVYVVPIPYAYKNVDGSLTDWIYDLSSYPETLKVISYEQFDFTKHYPEEIYIQVPYDQYNMTITVHPFFYASNIRNYTEKLVYTPYFYTADFENNSQRQMLNMDSYCTMPGVVLADCVYLQSETIRCRYLEKLCAFAGNDTLQIWQEKLHVLSFEKNTSESCKHYSAALLERLEQRNATQKKKILIYLSISTAAYNSQKWIDKIKNVIETFEKYKESILPIIKMDTFFEITEDLNCKKAASMFQCLLENYQFENWGIWDTSSDLHILADLADAFYGDPCIPSTLMIEAKKPVMICNYDI